MRTSFKGANGLENRILAELKQLREDCEQDPTLNSGLSNKALAQRLGEKYGTIRYRLIKLEKAGHVEERERLGIANVWNITDLGAMRVG